MAKKTIAFALILSLFPANFLFAQGRKSVNAAFWWSLFVPGGGYFYLGDYAIGAGFFAGTAGFLGWGIAEDSRKSGGELNAPLYYAQQLHVAQIYLTQREAMARFLSEGEKAEKKILLDQSSFFQLTASPFRKKNLNNPWVIGFGLLGVGLNYAEARWNKSQRDFADLRRIQILGNTYNRGTGLGIYSAHWIPISLGAGVSEEALFRGMIQTDAEERWGKTPGLLASSALFGLAHYDGTGESISNMIFAAFAGIFFGWRFQKNDYHLSESIAEHFWFDALAGLTNYFADPEHNALGAKVEFAY